jgi:hypothetical protein
MPTSLDLRATRFVRALALSACAASACRPQRREEPPPPPPIVDVQQSPEPVAVDDVPTVVEPAVFAVEDSGSTLRSDQCPIEQPGQGARCAVRQYCIYPQHAMQGTSCHCLLGDEARSNGEAPARWHCGPYQFVGVGPLPPPELEA